MATTILTTKSRKITVSGTSAHDIDFTGVIKDSDALVAVTVTSGTAISFSVGSAVDSNSLVLSSSGNNTKEIFHVRFNEKLYYTGGAGSEVFNVNVID